MTEDEFMGNLYQRFPVTIEKGLGSHVWDVDGKEYIDCMGGYGVALVGHRNERVVNALKSQLEKIITVHSSFYNKTREEFLKILISVSKVFYDSFISFVSIHFFFLPLYLAENPGFLKLLLCHLQILLVVVIISKYSCLNTVTKFHF